MIRLATASDPLRVAVLVSGAGSNLEALIARFQVPGSPVRIVAVASTRPGVLALDRATRAGIERAVFARDDVGAGRDVRLSGWLAERRVELVVLAGWMGILTVGFLDRHVAINVHPALLPSFPGAHGAADALAHGVRVTGVTVHLVDPGVDTGPILLQDTVPVHYDDSEGSLLGRLHEVEHRLLPDAVALLAADRVVLDGRIARVNRSEGS